MEENGPYSLRISLAFDSTSQPKVGFWWSARSTANKWETVAIQELFSLIPQCYKSFATSFLVSRLKKMGNIKEVECKENTRREFDYCPFVDMRMKENVDVLSRINGGSDHTVAIHYKSQCQDERKKDHWKSYFRRNRAHLFDSTIFPALPNDWNLRVLNKIPTQRAVEGRHFSFDWEKESGTRKSGIFGRCLLWVKGKSWDESIVYYKEGGISYTMHLEEHPCDQREECALQVTSNM